MRARTNPFAIPERLHARALCACALLALAGQGLYCVHLAEVAAWSVLANAGLPLLAVAVLAMSLAIVAILKATELLSGLKKLAHAIEADSGEGTDAVLSEDGTRAVARLVRAINESARHRANRWVELLQVLAAYAHDQRTPLTRMGMRGELIEDEAVREALQRDLAEMAELVEASLSWAKMQCSAGEQTQRVDADKLLDTR
ncbi:hypothetical protein PQQ86_32975 [Paraburkholderia sediminicola]|uniref:hypothetical protein n=1 Tax=Paraburkholderia sediminicola TaxID=458836 RepID=UPI0038B811E9